MLAMHTFQRLQYRHWQYLPGMLVQEPGRDPVRLGCRNPATDADRWWLMMDGEGNIGWLAIDGDGCAVTVFETDFKPVLEDPATLGCLLALVRAAWRCSVYSEPNGSQGWEVHIYAPTGLVSFAGDTEGAALLAALKGAA